MKFDQPSHKFISVYGEKQREQYAQLIGLITDNGVMMVYKFKINEDDSEIRDSVMQGWFQAIND